MLNEFLNFLGLDSKVPKNRIVNKNSDKALDDFKEQTDEYIVEMESPYFEEEITTQIIEEDNKKIELRKIKTKGPLNGGKTLITTKIYKKDTTRV